ncbi:MAG: hypothetical protein M1817_003571 [Caeruleum heppii]|nr:MAG: hypothetical protein M1817_003571 [Caeruleum heppii]
MSESVGMSSCCLSGKVHQGTAAGREETIGGVPTYVSEPENKSKAKTIIFITDIFGYKFNNVRLLADQYAKAGFYTYIPDVVQGDALPEAFLDDVEPKLSVREQLTMVEKAKKTANVGATFGPWLIKHREGVTAPIIDGFVDAVRKDPQTGKIGAIGFCWGGRYAILQAHKRSEFSGDHAVGGVDAVYACHPSLVAIPSDFDPVVRPLSLAVGDKDSLLDAASVEKIKDVLDKKTDVPHEVEVYKDQVHGFALRGDWSSEKDKEAMDAAEKQGIAWFNKHLA